MEAVVAAAAGGVTADGGGDGVVAGDEAAAGGDEGVAVGDEGVDATEDGGGDDVRAGVSAGGGDVPVAVVGGRGAGTSTLARGGVVDVVTPAASLPGSCDNGRGMRGVADGGVAAARVGSERAGGSDFTGGSDRTDGSDRADGSARAVRSGGTDTGGAFSGTAAVCCEGSTVGSGTFGDCEGGTDVTGGGTGDVSPPPTGDEATGAIAADSGAFDCCRTTAASTTEIPATTSSEAG